MNKGTFGVHGLGDGRGGNAKAFGRVTRRDIRSGPPTFPRAGDIWIATGVGVSSGSSTPSGTIPGTGGLSGNVQGQSNWVFLYDPDNSSANKWQFLSGAPILDYRNVLDSNSFAPATWGDCTGFEPGCYAPRTGEYYVEFGINQMWTTPLGNTLCGVWLNGVTNPGDNLAVWPGSDSTYKTGQSRFPGNMTKGDYYRMRQRQDNGAVGTVSCGYRWVSLLPIRVS